MKLNEQEFSTVRHYWRPPVATLLADNKLRNGEVVSLREAREASLKSQYFVAAKLEMTRGAYDSLEKKAQLGCVTIASLRKAAKALNCELVCSFRPKNMISFRDQIFETCLEFANRFPQIHRAESGNRRARFIATLASDALKTPKFKREQGWQREEIVCDSFNHLPMPTPASGMQ